MTTAHLNELQSLFSFVAGNDADNQIKKIPLCRLGKRVTYFFIPTSRTTADSPT